MEGSRLNWLRESFEKCEAEMIDKMQASVSAAMLTGRMPIHIDPSREPSEVSAEAQRLRDYTCQDALDELRQYENAPQRAAQVNDLYTNLVLWSDNSRDALDAYFGVQ